MPDEQEECSHSKSLGPDICNNSFKIPEKGGMGAGLSIDLYVIDV
jgi:hypothetical protein